MTCRLFSVRLVFLSITVPIFMFFPTTDTLETYNFIGGNQSRNSWGPIEMASKLTIGVMFKSTEIHIQRDANISPKQRPSEPVLTCRDAVPSTACPALELVAMQSSTQRRSLGSHPKISHRKWLTLPKTYNSSHLKMDGWNTIVSFWDGPFSGAMLVSGRVLLWFGL